MDTIIIVCLVFVSAGALIYALDKRSENERIKEMYLALLEQKRPKTPIKEFRAREKDPQKAFFHFVGSQVDELSEKDKPNGYFN